MRLHISFLPIISKFKNIVCFLFVALLPGCQMLSFLKLKMYGHVVVSFNII